MHRLEDKQSSISQKRLKQDSISDAEEGEFADEVCVFEVEV